ncbi:MAG: Maf family protein [Firmicutes bacterium]|nr:Maf family protein [Bacillota bacterium]
MQQSAPGMRLILASASPRRAEILRNAAIAFEVVPATVDESQRIGETPETHVRRLAIAKVRAVAAGVVPPALVLGADTAVLVDTLMLAKPASAEDARRMLRLLRGRTHEVLTGVALLRLPEGELLVEHERTRVTFAALSDTEVDDYIASGEPFDKAGGYAIQGRAGRFIPRIEGCYFNVVGLPLARVYRMLCELGWET